MSLRFEPIFNLGKNIVEELGAKSADTLTRWMGHYVAELIQAAETATGEDRSAKAAACAAAIISLWEHRGTLPKGNRPFEELDPILRTLESLDLNADRLRYVPFQPETFDEGGEVTETEQWLNTAKDLDYSARLLIGYCLVRAAETELEKSKEWVAMAEAAGVDKGVEFPIVHFLGSETDLLNAEDPDEKERKQIEDRIARLEAFREKISQVVLHLRGCLK